MVSGGSLRTAFNVPSEVASACPVGVVASVVASTVSVEGVVVRECPVGFTGSVVIVVVAVVRRMWVPTWRTR